MIVHALNNYYERLRDDSDINIPERGFSRQKVHFSLVLDKDGQIVQVRSLQEFRKKKPVPLELVAPVVKRTAGIAPNFLWDNTGYVLGADTKGKPERSLKAFEAFRDFHHTLGDELDDDGMRAVLRFLDTWEPERAPDLPHWEEMAGLNVVFELREGIGFIHDRPALKARWSEHVGENDSGTIATCLVSNERTDIAQLHPNIKGVKGAQTAGASLVSFNLNAFTSFGKKQSFNAPISEQIAFSYTAALNYLLQFDSRQKVLIGDAATVFWTERESPIEAFMGAILDPGDDEGELKEVRDFLDAVRKGRFPPEIDPDIRFYILGLSPNAARLSVRFWHVSTVREISDRIVRHFDDLAMIRSFENEPEYPGIWQLLKETAVLRKTANISPVLAGAFMRSIMTGAAYPQSLLTAVIGRIRADRTVNYYRAAMIKACLVRNYRKYNKGMEVKMALDNESTNTPYRLGRLFAVLEKVQENAHDGSLNRTIRDSFYASASANPRSVFPRLLSLSNHHISKLRRDKPGVAVNMEKLIGEIMGAFDVENNFPSALRLEDQGLFSIGYYHQRKEFFTKKEKREE